MQTRSLPSDYVIVILAAGNSSRLGQPKQLLPYQQHHLLTHTIQQALQISNARTIVVLGAYAQSIQKSLPTSVEIVFNPSWQEGMSSSIRVGIEKVMQLEPTKGCIICVCDQPFVTRELFMQLIEKQQNTDSSIVACAYGETTGVPVLFSMLHFEELKQLKGKSGAKSIIERHSSVVQTISFPQGVFDIDTQADYQQLLRL